MGYAWALVCSTAFVVVLLISASKDESMMEQREVTFDLDQIMQEMELPDANIMQREVDLTELLDPKEFPLQRPINPLHKERGGSQVFTQRRDPASFGPRSFGGPPSMDYPVQFPLSRPVADNIQAICLHGNHRPRYPDSYFPTSGYGQLKRMATAVNNAESWFDTCCEKNQTEEEDMMLCCATQAWERSLKLFCEENSRVKDRQHPCCLKRQNNILTCFNMAAQNPTYEPTQLLPVESVPPSVNFNFEPDTCQRRMMTLYRPRALREKSEQKSTTSQKIDISFPPGRPTADNIEQLCSNQKLRPLYDIRCLAHTGFELTALQAKTINRLEKGFKQCCKKRHGDAICADQKWRKELNTFCAAANRTQEEVDLQCCQSGEANDHYTCFQQSSPNPDYNITHATEEPSLSKLCYTHKLIQKRFPVGFSIPPFVRQCCHLADAEKDGCLAQKVNEMSAKLCPPKKTSSPAVRRCCKMPSQEEVSQCLSKIVTDAITRATSNLRRQQKKRCPIS